MISMIMTHTVNFCCAAAEVCCNCWRSPDVEWTWARNRSDGEGRSISLWNEQVMFT